VTMPSVPRHRQARNDSLHAGVDGATDRRRGPSTPPPPLGNAPPRHDAPRAARHVDRIEPVRLTQPLHGLTPASAACFRLGAVVHDVGRSVSKRITPPTAPRCCSRTRRSLTPAERRALVYLTLHHRGPVPAIGRDKVLSQGRRRRSPAPAPRDAPHARRPRQPPPLPRPLVFALGGMKLSTGRRSLPRHVLPRTRLRQSPQGLPSPQEVPGCWKSCCTCA